MHLAAPYMIDRFPHGSNDAESGKLKQNDQRLGCALLVFLGACLMMTVSLAASEMPIGHCSLPIMNLERGEPALFPPVHSTDAYCWCCCHHLDACALSAMSVQLTTY
jgi:hypothetical protein